MSNLTYSIDIAHLVKLLYSQSKLRPEMQKVIPHVPRGHGSDCSKCELSKMMFNILQTGTPFVASSDETRAGQYGSGRDALPGSFSGDQ